MVVTGKKIIRQSTFETNSSSSHSLVIGRCAKSTFEQFPRNSKRIYGLGEYGVTNGDEYTVDIVKLRSEVDKAKFMINIIASHIEEDDDDGEGHYPEVAFWFDHKNKIENPNRTFETLIVQKPFVWLKEVLESYTKTKFIFMKPKGNYFPYYETVYDEYKHIDKVTNIDFFDEKKFKERVSQIIFDKDIVIIDAGMPNNCNIYLKNYVY